MYQRGARGILVEPDPQLADLLRKDRPRDVVLNVGAAFDERRSATLKRFNSEANRFVAEVYRSL